MLLTDKEKAMLNGEFGEAVRLSMSILVDVGRLYDASNMISVAMVHDDSIFCVGKAQIDFAEHLVQLGGQFAVPTSSNACNIDQQRWREQRFSEESAEQYLRLIKAHLHLGAVPTFTCAPYQAGLIPRFGQDVAWAESNATVFANSVIGARTNRYAGLLELCVSLAGLAPNFGLHKLENRRAEIIININDLTDKMLTEASIWPLLGYAVGESADDRVVAIEGAPAQVSIDALKSFGAAAASSGAVALFHLIGVTPEAPERDACIDKNKPLIEDAIFPATLREVERKISTAQKGDVDLIVLGCPHFSYQEFLHLTRLLSGRKIHLNVNMWVFSSRSVYHWLIESGLLDTLQDAGIKVFTDGCSLTVPYHLWNTRTIMTNSAKMANYYYSDIGISILYSGLEDCIESAIAGRYIRKRKPWDK
jgi:predicted aconitase